jgi:uncharacterized RDD family membrane protein YckC
VPEGDDGGARGIGAPDWRGEVSERLQAYRKRQRRLCEGPSQPELTFHEEEAIDHGIQPPLSQAANVEPVVTVSTVATVQPPYLPQTPRRLRAVPAQQAAQQAAYGATPLRRSIGVRSRERIEIDLLQPSLDFASDAAGSRAELGVGGWHAALVSQMASLRERRLAAMLDATLLLAGYGSFLALFCLLGGSFAVSKVDAAVLGATLGLFYGQYFALFTFFGGVTPGMMWRKLHLTRFDGREPLLQDRVWRSFGYLLSAATLMLGFMWALWDEDHLCWHDRISHTHLTWAGGMNADQSVPDEAVQAAETTSTPARWRRSS